MIVTVLGTRGGGGTFSLLVPFRSFFYFAFVLAHQSRASDQKSCISNAADRGIALEGT